MKRVLFIRHAKSSWEDGSLDDFERPLNDRGKRNAPEMAKRLLDREIQVDQLISSPALRAYTTAILFAKELGIAPDQIRLFNELYLPSAHTIGECVAMASDDADTIAIFSHNPGITEYVNSISPIRIDNMPTAAVFAVKAPVSSWAAFKEAEKEFWFFDYPKAKPS